MTKSLEPKQLRDGIECRISDQMPVPAYRPVQMVSLGCHGDRAVMPHPDHTDPESILLGHNRRVCFEPPKKNNPRMKKFEQIVEKWIKTNLTPLSSDSDISMETWLGHTHYPEWRKQELRDTWKLFDSIVEKRHFVVNSFTKDETYPEYKNLRGIQARTDMFKCAVGPYFKLIEKEVFKNPWFIKYVPVPERPKFIYERRYGNSDYYATDHTSFEGHFSQEFMESCEFLLYDYMTQHMKGHEEFQWYVHNVLGSDNHVVSKYFSYHIRATRMTGEMCTSLGNGFSNLMMILFAASESGSETLGVVEGDDSLFRLNVGTKLDTQVFTDLGFVIKLEKCEELHTASFCGNVFQPGDYFIVTDPVEALISFGWTRAVYAKSKTSKLKRLLRSKALSLLYEYRGCPILKHLALYGLRMTENFRSLAPKTNEYERELFQMQLEDIKENGLPIVEIPIGTRLLVEQLYGISVEVQFKYEDYLDSLSQIQPLSLELLDLKLNKHQVHYSMFYVQKVNMKDNLNYPNIPDSSDVVWNKSYIDKVNKSRTAFHSH
jgi:hypothetical protein